PGAAGDSFWSWREAMYRAVAALDPPLFEAVAAQLYVEMLKSGFTTVAEFHYLHHAPDGRPYADPAEMSLRVLAAAATAGIGLTLLPVLYAAGGFGGAPAGPGQRRFVHDIDGFLRLLARLRALTQPAGGQPDGALPGVVLGVAPHSLRAVPPEALAALLAAAPDGPVHIHVAEQPREVADCLAQTGQRPVEWLLAHARPDARWCLVHATHMTGAETAALAASGAVAGLCPTTEANLGDGIFPAEAFLAAGGRFGIGSDSHISVSPVEELRWLEYAQRLATGRRAVLAGGPGRSTGRALFDAALAGGTAASGHGPAGLVAGGRADIVVLDTSHPLLLARDGDALLDSWIFAGNAPLVRHVVAAGRHVVADFRHAAEAAVARRFAAAMTTLAE
ncbi:MAG: formimidoylglutamate deiminase, partial [Rhodospirillales bacterium]|nr:formimidoylglutamate deiminase [Rhodospirillales bacterium]